jgi:pilus assembly protein CpaE
MSSRKALVVTAAAGGEQAVKAVLTRFGFLMDAAAATTAQALSRLAENHYDLVILALPASGSPEFASIERALRGSPHTQVIGVGSSADPQLILQAMRSGVHEFLVSGAEQTELAAAVDRLQSRLASNRQRGQIFAVYSGKGGVGTTSVAVNLAHALAANHKEGRVAIVDLHVGGGDVRVQLNIPAGYHLGSAAEKLDRMDATLLKSLLTPVSDGIWVLPAPDDPELEDVIDSTATTSVLEHLRSQFAFTILDCEHHLTERTLAAMDIADKVLVVTQLSVPSLRSTQRTLSVGRRLGYTDDRFLVVVNRQQPGDVLSTAEAVQAIKHEVFWQLPNDYRSSTDAQTRGVSVLAVSAASKLAESYVKLAAKLGGAAPQSNEENGARRPSKLRGLFGTRRS